MGPTPEEVEAHLDDILIERGCVGYSKQFVKPPWSRASKVCRSCLQSGKKGPWALSILVHGNDAEKVIFFTFATVCRDCGEDQEKMQALTQRAFSLQ